MSGPNLKFCACGNSYQYSCARCQGTFCLACDRPADTRETKTIIRYCSDWRCQREKQIEEGVLEVTQRRKP